MILKSITAGLALCLSATSASALNIALTNDDGWTTPGIQALYDALTEAGHTVILAGPLNGQSGSSAAINIGAVEVTREAEFQYSVALPGGEEGAEPSTAGAIAIDIARQVTGEAPDLLVSGINDSANLAAATYTSGTVGAAIQSLGLLTNAESIPAIAISTDDRCDEDLGPSEACRTVADFLVDYIAHLEQRPVFKNGFSRILPDGRGLNINYPPGEVVGVAVAKQGQLPRLIGQPAGAEIGCPDCASAAIGETVSGGLTGLAPLPDDLVDHPRADQALFAEGYVTVVIIEPSYQGRAVGLTNFLRTYED